MPVYDFKCDTCGAIETLLVHSDVYKIDACEGMIDRPNPYQDPHSSMLVPCPGSLHRVVCAPAGVKVKGGFTENMVCRGKK